MDRQTSPVAIGIDIGGSWIKGGIVTSTGDILYHLSVPTHYEDGQETVREVLELITRLQALAPVSAIGISSTGIVNAEQGVILESGSIKQYDGTNWKSILTEKYSLPVSVDNDVRSAAWGEFVFARLPENSVISLIAVGTGIGCGIIVNGRIWSGGTSAAGEVGYIIINPDGPEHNGIQGPLEAYATAKSIVAYVREKIKAGYRSSISDITNNDPTLITIPIIKQAEEGGDRLAKEAFTFAGEMLGVGIVSLVHVLNPHRVILGGGVVEASETFSQAAISQVMKRTLRSSRVGLEITIAQLGNRAALVGAALLALNARSGEK